MSTKTSKATAFTEWKTRLRQCAFAGLFAFLAACDYSLGGTLTENTCPLADLSGAREDTLDALPRWSYTPIWAAVPLQTLRDNNPGWQGSYVLSLRMLAWSRTAASGGFPQDNALFWVELGPEARTTGWALLHFVGNGETGRWDQAHVVSTADRAPTNVDVYGALDAHTDWRFKPDLAFTFVAGWVRQRTWLQVVGEKPSVTFDVEYALRCQ